VWLYDAHHDSGYPHKGDKDYLSRLLERGAWSCEDWMVLYRALGADLHVRYPEWRAWAVTGELEPAVYVDRRVDDGSVPDLEFDKVFVCRSGAWVPPWHDEAFNRFVAAAPIRSSRKFDIQPGGTHVREWHDEDPKLLARLSEDKRIILGNLRRSMV